MLIAASAVAVTLAGATPASSVTPVERSALKALATTRVTPTTKERGRAEIRRAAYLARTLPGGRREHIGVALGEIASFAGKMTEPRALALIGELKANDDYFLKHYAPQPKTDITDADGIVYRYFAGRCFEFHPLANFGALNARVAAGDIVGSQRLADALVARGIYQSSGGIGWEYTFPFGGGRAPWLSGMAQAVAAQALARTAGLVPAEATSLMGKARAACQAISGRLLTSVAAGPWIRLYSFTSLVVLNAQLQAVISLQSYATTANDSVAAALALRMQRAAAASLTRFDTGYWSYYALPHDPSPLDYHQYVVQLLQRLKSADPRFAAAAVRFAAYEKQPPAFQLAPGSLGALTFWLSKPSTVSVVTGAGPSRRVTFDGGWHTLSWGVPKHAGNYPVHVTATDSAGNHTTFDALPIVRATATVATPKGAAQSAAETTPPVAPSLRVGATLTDPSQSAAAAQAGLHLVRVNVTWPAGATAPDPTLVAALQQSAPIETIVELIAAPLPIDDAGRAALAQYAAALAAGVKKLQALVLAPAPVAADTPSYAAAFDAIRAALPDSPLGVAVDGSISPTAAVSGLAGLDANVVAFHPAGAAAKGVLTLANLSQFQDAFPDASLVIDGAPAPYDASLKTAACTPDVSAVLFDRLTDATRAGLRSTIGTAERGAFVCPGIAAEAQPFDVQYPSELTQPIGVSLNCNRDCLYLVTLDRADGRPVVAHRGQLNGGPASPLTKVTLPRAKLAAGTYQVDVRIVARVNPGAVTRYLSPPLTAG
ncbi:MAG: hypothetical protein QOH16_2556 [Gaiellaceae bacterium]|nr:hypothetical protein [Gaiellaceae bacterium]